MEGEGEGKEKGKGGSGKGRMSFNWVVCECMHFIVDRPLYCVLSFCVLGGAMAPASNPLHSPSPAQTAVPPPPPPGGVAAAGPLLTTDRQTNRSHVITYAVGKGMIVFINLCDKLILLLCMSMMYRYYSAPQKPR